MSRLVHCFCCSEKHHQLLRRNPLHLFARLLSLRRVLCKQAFPLFLRATLGGFLSRRETPSLVFSHCPDYVWNKFFSLTWFASRIFLVFRFKNFKKRGGSTVTKLKKFRKVKLMERIKVEWEFFQKLHIFCDHFPAKLFSSFEIKIRGCIPCFTMQMYKLVMQIQPSIPPSVWIVSLFLRKSARCFWCEMDTLVL